MAGHRAADSRSRGLTRLTDDDGPRACEPVRGMTQTVKVEVVPARLTGQYVTATRLPETPQALAAVRSTPSSGSLRHPAARRAFGAAGSGTRSSREFESGASGASRRSGLEV